MTTAHLVPPADPGTDLAQLHAEVAAFNAEMRQTTPADPRRAWLPFGLGAAFALVVFVLVTLLPRLA
ncbi:hypothetical protein HDC30_005759 [Pseudomonas sp. JAI115]|uniref:hypothetical protein n=1 Tax=Pseudomonas sp. JAI115 TaxID=2723061 RepID=UPI00160AB8FF|nr:hypothetical protein [Pseudomonas sp. JAI115]MBB6158501.1 hypothetical protein [Pseudomonas sp. JAI115]